MEKSIGNFTYSQQKYLGRGSYSTVYEGRNDKTHEIVAVKIIEKRLMQSQLNAELILGEIETMKTINHPNLVKMYEVYQTQNNIYLILEFCNQGDLDSMIKKKVLDETQAINILKQIVDGYEYLYKMGIMHRDLKPTDFGFALKTQQNQQVKTRLAGTPAYASPQMLTNQFYSYLNDMWSLGVLTYEMLHGNNPWVYIYNYKPLAQNQQHLIQLMTTGQIQLKSQLSQQIKDLICSLLKFEEQDRLTLQELQKHQLLNQLSKKRSQTIVYKSPLKMENDDLLFQFLKNLQQNLFQLEFDTPNIVLQYIIQKLIIKEGRNLNLMNDYLVQTKNNFKILTSELENQQYLSDIIYTENEKIQDFSEKFTKFVLKQIQQSIRRFNHKISIKSQHDINDFKIIELMQRLCILYQHLKNNGAGIKDNIFKIDFSNFKQYLELRNRLMLIID